MLVDLLRELLGVLARLVQLPSETRKAEREIRKADLEIEALTEEKWRRESLIRLATDEEVERISPFIAKLEQKRLHIGLDFPRVEVEEETEWTDPRDDVRWYVLRMRGIKASRSSLAISFQRADGERTEGHLVEFPQSGSLTSLSDEDFQYLLDVAKGKAAR